MYLKGLEGLRGFLTGAAGQTARRDRLGGEQLDVLVASYVDYVHSCGTAAGCSYLTRAAHGFHGLLWAYPRIKGQLAVASNALKGFKRLRPSGSRDPVPWGVLGVLATDALRRAALAPQAERAAAEGFALNVLLSSDCFLRPGEAAGLQLGDVADGGHAVSLKLGVRQATKTGWNQGVVVHCTFVTAFLRKIVARRRALGAADDEPLFPEDRDVFAGRLARAALDWGAGDLTPHVLRHSGASYWGGVLRKRAADLQLRGRWASVKSVDRYTKPATLVAAWAQLPPRLARLAREFEADGAGMLARAAQGLALSVAPTR